MNMNMINNIGFSLIGFIMFYFFFSNMSLFSGVSTINKTPKEIENRKLLWSGLFALALFLATFSTSCQPTL